MAGNTLSLNIVVGAALAGGFRSAIDGAKGKIGEIKASAEGMGQALADIGTAYAGLTVLKEAKDAAVEMQAALLDAGITADMSDEQVAQLRRNLNALSVPDKTNQSVTDLLRGFTSLVSAGMDQTKAQASMYALGRTATAANADVEDLSKTAFVLVDTLGVAPDALTTELDRLAYAGKQGAFELRDMARNFPTLGASAKTLGLKGSEAVATLGAALQIAKKGAGDPSEAANNMKNFLAKATAPETVKRFEKHGVNLKKVLNDALAKGENPMEAVPAKIETMTRKNFEAAGINLKKIWADAVAKGENPMDAVKAKVDEIGATDPFKIGDLFGDMQVQNFLLPMLANMEEYRKLKADVLKAQGTVDTDYARRMGTAKEGAKATAVAFDRLKEAVGHAFLPFISGVGVMSEVVGWLADAADQAPNTTLAITGAATALTVLPPVIRGVAIAWKFLDISMKASAVGLAIGALAVGAGLIIDNWSTVKGFFTDLWNEPAGTVRAFIATVGEQLGPLADWFQEKWTPVGAFFGSVWTSISEGATAVLPYCGLIGFAASTIVENWSTLRTFFTTLWDDPSAAATMFMDWVSGATKGVADLIVNVWNAPREALEKLWDGVLVKWEAAVNSITGLWDKAAVPVRAIVEWTGIGDSKPKPPSSDGAAVAFNAAPPAGKGVAIAETKGRDALRPTPSGEAATLNAAPPADKRVAGADAKGRGALGPTPSAGDPAPTGTEGNALVQDIANAVRTAMTGSVEIIVSVRGAPANTTVRSTSPALTAIPNTGQHMNGPL